MREVRLEGFGLLFVGLLLVGTLAGSFVLGRRYERNQQPPLFRADSSDPFAGEGDGPRQAGAQEVGAGDFFDTVDGGEKQVEPDREIKRPTPARQPATDTAAASKPQPGGDLPRVDGGDFWVQVFAGRDRDAASDYVRKLEEAGHTVKLHTVREGSGALYKVRVGGWVEESTARRAAETLRGDGYPGAWVTRWSS